MGESLVNYEKVRDLVEFAYNGLGKSISTGDKLRIKINDRGGVYLILLPYLMRDYEEVGEVLCYYSDAVPVEVKWAVDLMVVSCVEILDIFPNKDDRYLVSEHLRGPRKEDVKSPGIVIGKELEMKVSQGKMYFLSMVGGMLFDRENPDSLPSRMAKYFYDWNCESKFMLKSTREGYSLVVFVGRDFIEAEFDRDYNIVKETAKEKGRILSDKVRSKESWRNALIGVLGKFDSLSKDLRGMIGELNITKPSGTVYTSDENVRFLDVASDERNGGRVYYFTIEKEVIPYK